MTQQGESNFSFCDDVALAQLTVPKLYQKISSKQACQLAVVTGLQGEGYVSPNPLVGAVLVDQEHRFIACGAHLSVGEAHAEVNAIQQAISRGVSTRGLHMYVTLEPCAHVGRTPPCARYLVAQGIAELSYAVVDPNPQVSGSGAAILQGSGVKVNKWSDFTKEASRLAEIFLYNETKREIFIAAKIASDNHGVYGAVGGRREFITGQRARVYGHYLRQRFDAVAVGADTLILDNPELSPRDVAFKPRLPWRIVLDGSGRALSFVAEREKNGESTAILKHSPDRVVWVTRKDAQLTRESLRVLERKGVIPFQVASLDALLKELWALGIRSLLLEGGGGLWGSFTKAGLVNKLYHFQASHTHPCQFPLTAADTIFKLTEKAYLVRQHALSEDWLFEYDCNLR